ncbi:MAG TPA: hypothetical protein VM661_04395 [Candidatus Sulfotelmatobacter sp.]|nr:hypothetical protein [Candidatus Sulfotelmatobacter sp.]
MLFPNAQSIAKHLSNAAGALLVGLVFAYIGLNAATGCGQGGQCVSLSDFHAQTLPVQMAERASRHTGS